MALMTVAGVIAYDTPIGVTPAPGDDVGIGVNGSTWTIYVNGATVRSGAIPAVVPSGGTLVGIEIQPEATSRFDSFRLTSS